ncbi:MAG: CBS domain-containing protein [Fusobacteriaceae bacterium]
MKKIADVMNPKIITIKEDTNFQEIVNIMKEYKIGKLPVLENEIIKGVVTRADILVRQERLPVQPVIAFWEVLITLPTNGEFEKRVQKLSAYMAKDIMSEEFYTCDSEDTLEKVATEMLELKHDFALVLKEEKLVGILTKTDLINNCY